MFKMEHIGYCPFCNKQIIGKDNYASHLIEESERAVGALNEAMSDLKKAGREGYQIVSIKSIVNGNHYLALEKGNNGF